MNVDHARELKQRILQAVATAPIAVGLTPTGQRDDFRVAILLHRGSRLPSLPKIPYKEIEIVALPAIYPATGVTRERASQPSVLRIGASVGHGAAGDGSLGFFARRRSDERRGFVSCNHVIARGDRGKDGDAVVSPSPTDGGRTDRDTVGWLDGTYPRLANPGSVDCAFAALAEPIAYDPASVDGGKLSLTPAVLESDIDVTKSGKATPARTGRVHRIEVDHVPMQYGTTKVFFDDVIQIGSSSAARFSEYGDSGALVYTTHTFQPVGLLFATSAVGGPHDAGWTWAHPIERVTAALGVDLAVE